MSLHHRFGIASIFLALCVDQGSKWLVLLFVMDPPRVIPLTSFFNLVLTWNSGISFGMFSNGGEWGVWIFSSLAIMIVALLFYWLFRAKTNKATIALGLIIGGALGNVADRFIHSAVMDFLDFYYLGFHWPAFNAADSFITIGATVLIVDSLFSQRKTD